MAFLRMWHVLSLISTWTYADKYTYLLPKLHVLFTVALCSFYSKNVFLLTIKHEALTFC